MGAVVGHSNVKETSMHPSRFTMTEGVLFAPIAIDLTIQANGVLPIQ